MDMIIILLLIIIACLVIFILFKLRGISTENMNNNLLLPIQQIQSDLGKFEGTMNARIDSSSQAINTTLNSAIQQMTQSLTTSITSIREETREKMDSRLLQFQTEQQSNIDKLREGMQKELASGRKELSDTLNIVSASLQERFEKLQVSNEVKLNEIRQNVEQKLSENIEKNISVFQDMTQRLGDLKATNERIVEISKDINQLSDILQSPKLRGGIGEFQLENMLRQIIPTEHFQSQVKVGEGLADAVIFLREGKLCIDSKFPLENFRRLIEPNITEDERKKFTRDFASDVKKHADNIASKYILPKETLDFAFMFIPAENVYYEILLNPELHQYSLSRKVVPVSPNTLYAYLQAIAIGFRGMKIEQESKLIEQILLGLKKNFDKFKDHFRLIGTHIDRAKSQFVSADTDIQRFDTTISSLKMGELASELPPADEEDEDK